jgi:hypothetical protein
MDFPYEPLTKEGFIWRPLQNRAEAQTKDVTIWAWEPRTTKARKGQPQPIEQRTEKRWIVSGQPVQSTSKEGHQKDKEIYQEVVRLL